MESLVFDFDLGNEMMQHESILVNASFTLSFKLVEFYISLHCICQLSLYRCIKNVVIIIIHHAVVQLSGYTLPDGLQSVNGSHHNGQCEAVAQGRICVGTSVLTDGNVPSLGGFQGNWAAGLLTVNRSGQPFHIGFDPGRTVGVTRVELDMFNCPHWGIAAPRITVYTLQTFPFFHSGAATIIGSTTTETITSCNSTVRVIISLQSPQNLKPYYFIEFTFNVPGPSGSKIEWVHIAEVVFYGENAQSTMPSSTAGMILYV